MGKKKQDIEKIEYEMSGGNVFADIGVENPEEELTKAKLVWEIEQIITQLVVYLGITKLKPPPFSPS